MRDIESIPIGDMGQATGIHAGSGFSLRSLCFQGVLLLSSILGKIPLRIRLRACHMLAYLWFVVFRFRRDVILDNLRLAFGLQLSEKAIVQLGLENCRHYMKMLMETFILLHWTDEQIRELPCEGMHHVRDALKEGNGMALLGGHLGNWEHLVMALGAWGVPSDVIVRKPRTPWVGELFLQYRKRATGVRMFLESGTARQLVRSLKDNRVIGFSIDQFMGPPMGIPARFFGELAGTTNSLAFLHELHEFPIIPVYSYRDALGRQVTRFDPPVQFQHLSDDRNTRMYQKTQAFNDVMEAAIRKYPDQWLWMHRRWKRFVGTPKWAAPEGWPDKVPRALAQPILVVVISMLISGCALLQTPSETTTHAKAKALGIEIPEEPVLNIPKEAPLEADTVRTPPPGFVAPVTPPSKVILEAPRTSAVVIPPQRKEVLKPHRRLFDVRDLPFEPGEKIVMELNWTMLNAGKISMEVKNANPLMFGGRPVVWLSAHVRSSPVVDTIYRIDNVIQSFVDREWFLPYKFLLTMDESLQFKETRVVFDHTKKVAHYWSNRRSERWGNDVQGRDDGLEPNAVDMFSAIYYARLLNYKMGEYREFPVYENNQKITIGVLPVANELVTTPVGAFQAWKIKVSLKLDNVLKPTGDLFLWLSDDSKKYLVKFDATLKLGNLKGQLVELRDRLR